LSFPAVGSGCRTTDFTAVRLEAYEFDTAFYHVAFGREVFSKSRFSFGHALY
jgi:hypothetical protein